MKKHLLFTALLLVLSLLLLAGCGKGGVETGAAETDAKSSESNTETTTTVTDVTVVVRHETVEVSASELETFDFTELFQITVNGESIPVEPSYLETRHGGEDEDTLTVTCTYEGKQATVTVRIIRQSYAVESTQDEVTLKQSDVATYDFLSLFTVTLNGEAAEITEEMIRSTVCDTVGDYTYTVRYGDASRTLTVHVIPDHIIEAIPSYRDLELTLAELAEFDFKGLFSLYVDGAPVPVTDEMLDTSAVENATEGNSYGVILRYSLGKSSCEVAATFRVVAKEQAVLTAKNVVTYPNAQVIDLTTLFTITVGDTEIPVTRDMISGEVDYGREAVYTITLTYEGQSVFATVEVKRGVVIGYATSDVIRIQKGTNPATYAFDEDFVVIVNGLRFTEIPMSCLDLTGVDFDTPGVYPVTLTIKYNADKLTGISGNFTFTEYTATIRYEVVKNTYSVSVTEPELILKKGTSEYNLYKNLLVIINGRKQTITENPAFVDSISCYAETLSDPIDFTSAARQTVRIAVYPNGPEEEPVIVEYALRIESDVQVTATGTAIFAGNPLHITELFSVTEGGVPVPVTNDMISGKVDTFCPGIYTVSIEYLGITAEAQVVVFDDGLAGIYHTGLVPISSLPVLDDEDDDSDSGSWGDDSDWEEYGILGSAADPYAASYASAATLGDMVIGTDGSVTVNGTSAKIISGIDQNTMVIRLGSNDFTLYFDNGIAVLVPDNSLKMSYGETKRPLIYFHEDQWKIVDHLTVNSTDAHVLQNTITAYSYDIFCINSIDNLEKIWYTLKINLVEKTSSDTIYTVSWGEVSLADDFSKIPGAVNSMVYDGETVSFTMVTDEIAKVNRASDRDRLFANMTFTGTIDGRPAVLSANQYEHFILTVDGKQIFYANPSSYADPRSCVNYETGEIFLYDAKGTDYPPYSYRFIVDTKTKTFTYVERDSYFGKYVCGSMYLFLDGYGTGIINFNTSSYYTTRFTYTVQDGELSVRYRDTAPSFAYGEGADFYISPLLNVLTVKRFDGALLVGKEFVNTTIVDGAIVRISSYQVGAGATGRNSLLGQITIITKDGELTGTEKANCISTSAVKFTVAGFYQFTVTVRVGGEDVTNYYAVQVLDAAYSDSPLVGLYSGAVNGNNYLEVTRYGQVILSVGGTVYTGLVSQITDTTLYARVYNENRACISVNANLLADGLLEVYGTGAVGFSDLYTTGTVRSVGLTGKERSVFLRIITVGDNEYFYQSGSASGYGVLVEVASVNGVAPASNGAILCVTASAGTKTYLKVSAWGNLSDGLVLSDAWRGTYESENRPQLILDGFGNAILGDAAGSYRVGEGIVTLSVSSGSILVYRLNVADGTYSEVTYISGNEMLSGKTFSASYTFYCGVYAYNAETRFVFGENGVVTVYSTSSDHDEECDSDRYTPVFASRTGVRGTYSVTADHVTVTVGGETFVFLIPNVVAADRITCESTTLTSGEHGYFRVGETFAE